jgi:predicted dehydrogenase
MIENATQAEKEFSAAAPKGGKHDSITQNRRHLDPIVQFRLLLASRAIGDLTTLNADFYLGAHFGGFREEMEHVLLLDKE